MAPRIHQHIRERMPHFSRRAKDVEVEAVGENGALAPEDAVHGSRDARSDGFHPTGKLSLAHRLDQHVNVIVLD
jgi:hypothetical protein